MYCSNCGKEIVNKSRFCPYCGANIGMDNIETVKSISSNEIKENYAKPSRKRTIDVPLLIFWTLTLTIVICVCVVSYNKRQLKGRYYEIDNGIYTGRYIDFKDNGIAEDPVNQYFYEQEEDIVAIWDGSAMGEVVYYEYINGVLYCMGFAERAFYPEYMIEKMDDLKTYDSYGNP